MHKDLAETYQRKKAFLDKVNIDPELYTKVMEELERRKTENTEILRSYGLAI